ncbi:hypothetical protein HMPREF1624_01721 [Sporothrix schenckii ATCC 58251]|uniref:SH3 domain-containing protein n=1 Tax=Sporothrix schenckii (strain ATCC 58251 / de Perez 2211183) TaxID=1391915 RepID=U7Q9I0_SPOS1|nr:hypothetical protein HMPREF1624_01721 [Sporothrix schenckii ATCC 58251]
MAQVRPRVVRPHGVGRRDLWDSITSAVGNAFDPHGKDAQSTSTSTKEQQHKTKTKTVLTTDAPSTYTGPLTTKTQPTKPAAKTTETTPTKTATTSAKAATTKTTSKAAAKTSDTTSENAKDLPKSIAATTAPNSETRLAVDTTKPTTTTSASPTLAAASATNTATASSGSSTGAKAGIAIGVLAGVFFVFAIIFFLFRRHRKQVEDRRVADDEKNGPFADSAAIGGAPRSRLSLKPVAQFLGGAGAGAGAGAAAGAAANSQYDNGFPNRRQSRGANIAMRDQPPMSARSQPGSAWERPITGNDRNNPFGDGAQRLTSAFSTAQHGFPGANPQGPDANGVSPVSPGGAGTAFAGGAAAGAAAGMLTRKASTRKDGPNALDLTLPAPNSNNSNLGPVPPSPAATEYSMHSMATSTAAVVSAGGAAIAAAGGPPVSTVHRVQLDFKPTLDDELDLRAGQLVRLLHEYDDGWALCIRLDRSKQGVVPRTCLSTRPVKPRPLQGGGRAGPPVNPSGRPITPQGGPFGPGRMPGPMGGPMGVPGSMVPGQGGRPQSPANGPNTPQGGPPSQKMMNGQMRPQSPYGGPPGGPRSASPATIGARSVSPLSGSIGRPQSPAELSGASSGTSGSQPQSPASTGLHNITPPGPSPVNKPVRPTNSIGRKPVPGQAL